MDERYVELVVLEVGGRRYGLLASEVQELLRAAALTPLPGAPAVVEGILNLRGRVVPVVDVRARLGLPAKSLEPTDHFIVVKVGDRLTALRVDRAVELVRVHAAAVEYANDPAGVADVPRVAKLPNELLLVVNLRTFLSPAETAALEKTLPTSARSEGGRS